MMILLQLNSIFSKASSLNFHRTGQRSWVNGELSLKCADKVKNVQLYYFIILFPTDHRVQEEVNALWEGEGFSSLED